MRCWGGVVKYFTAIFSVSIKINLIKGYLFLCIKAVVLCTPTLFYAQNSLIYASFMHLKKISLKYIFHGDFEVLKQSGGFAFGRLAC